MPASYNLNVTDAVPRFTYVSTAAPRIDGAKIAILQTKFYSEYTNTCVNKFREIMRNSGVAESDISLDILPGTIEVPLAAQRIARVKKPDAIAFFGGVVNTDTHHSDMILSIFTRGITDVMLQNDVPILVGLIYVPKLELLISRCQDNDKNYGIKIALAATEIINFRRQNTA